MIFLKHTDVIPPHHMHHRTRVFLLVVWDLTCAILWHISHLSYHKFEYWHAVIQMYFTDETNMIGFNPAPKEAFSPKYLEGCLSHAHYCMLQSAVQLRFLFVYDYVDSISISSLFRPALDARCDRWSCQQRRLANTM